ncbi:MAG: cysteine desulfurase [Myxococcales bacterium]|nr:cysteine desulfurase [Myxococcales bacterium]USN50027.1 MAG: cysteine desulfurase [Myxococcales bacterium]
MPDKAIYLDHHATTPLDKRVFNKMKTFFLCEFGNPSSRTHAYGWRALEAVNEARRQVAQALNADAQEIIFTSGATEASNMAIKGFLSQKNHKQQIITSSIEHPATFNSIKSLEPNYAHGIFLQPKSDGIIDPAQFENAITKNTILASFFWVNSEIGSINNIREIASIAKKHGVLLHCDAAQALGRLKIDLKELDIDLISLSGHKIYGPKGIGVLYIKHEIKERFQPLLHGGAQEWSLRPGTLNVPGIVGMGEAARLSVCDLDKEVKKIKELRDILWDNLRALSDIYLNGSLEHRVAGNLNVSFADIDGEELVLALCKRVAISTGSACCSHGPSRVLEEIGVAPELRQAAIRFGIGRSNSKEEIHEVSQLVVETVKKLRAQNKKKLVKLI